MSYANANPNYFFILLACSRDSPPDAVLPSPTVIFTLAVNDYEWGSVNDPGDTHNENANVSVTATPETGFLVCKKLI